MVVPSIPHRRPALGFTMVETMVVVLILGILAAFAAPAMKDLLRTQRVRSATYDLLADLTFARSQAVTLGHNVSVASSGGSTDWAPGYTITDTTASPNRSLRSQSAVASSVAFTGDQSSLVFDRTGHVTSGGSANNIVSFNIAPTDSTAPSIQKRCVRIDPSGRPRAVEGVCS
jgi:type IV fimbrial biogenesis protein FimT